MAYVLRVHGLRNNAVEEITAFDPRTQRQYPQANSQCKHGETPIVKMNVQFEDEVEVTLRLEHVLDRDDVRVLKGLQDADFAHQGLLSAIKLLLVDYLDGVALAGLLVHAQLHLCKIAAVKNELADAMWLKINLRTSPGSGGCRRASQVRPADDKCEPPSRIAPPRCPSSLLCVCPEKRTRRTLKEL